MLYNIMFQENWEVLLGIWLLGTTFWRGLSNHQAATAQMGTRQAEFPLRIKTYRRGPTPLRSTSPFSEPGRHAYAT